MATYDHATFDRKWQQYWEREHTFATPTDRTRPKYYVLDMFPYPSGDGLHVGHPRGYTATDVIARAKRMMGFNVLRVMGWDSFGLPAERRAQRDGIGKSIGANATFTVVGTGEPISVFTTRPDTLFGGTYVVLAPEHPLVARITTSAQRAAVAAYCEGVAARSERERTAEAADAPKTGVATGAYAINPVNGAHIPIWVADYVLASYGTGAVSACPAHDERDWAFAKKFGLPIVEVVTGGDVERDAYLGDGAHVNSAFLDGLDVAHAKEKVIAWLEERGLGERAIRYRLRDWLFSRQRYWGEPFPDDRARRRHGEAVAEGSASRRAAGDRRVPAHARRTASARARAGVAPDARSADGAGGPPRDQHDAAVGGIVLVLPALPVTHARRRRLGSRGGEVLDAGRPLRRRLRACDAAPPLRAVLAQGAVRRRARLDEGAVPASRPPRHDPQALLPRRARQVSLRGRGRRAWRRLGSEGHGRARRRVAREDVEVEVQRRQPRRHVRAARCRRDAALRAVHGADRGRHRVGHRGRRRHAALPRSRLASAECPHGPSGGEPRARARAARGDQEGDAVDHRPALQHGDRRDDDLRQRGDEGAGDPARLARDVRKDPVAVRAAPRRGDVAAARSHPDDCVRAVARLRRGQARAGHDGARRAGQREGARSDRGGAGRERRDHPHGGARGPQRSVLPRGQADQARDLRQGTAGQPRRLIHAFVQPSRRSACCDCLSVRVHDRAQHDAALVRPVVAGAAVHRRALVPDQHIADAPAVVVDEALLGCVLGELLDERPRLFPLHADEPMRMHGIDEQDRTSADRVPGDRRPLHFLVLLVGRALVGAVQAIAGGTIRAAVQANEAGQPLFLCLGQGVVGRAHVGEHGAAFL